MLINEDELQTTSPEALMEAIATLSTERDRRILVLSGKQGATPAATTTTVTTPPRGRPPGSKQAQVRAMLNGEAHQEPTDPTSTTTEVADAAG